MKYRQSIRHQAPKTIRTKLASILRYFESIKFTSMTTSKETSMGLLTLHALEMEMSDWLDTSERMLIMARLSPPLRKRHND